MMSEFESNIRGLSKEPLANCNFPPLVDPGAASPSFAPVLISPEGEQYLKDVFESLVTRFGIVEQTSILLALKAKLVSFRKEQVEGLSMAIQESERLLAETQQNIHAIL